MPVTALRLLRIALSPSFMSLTANRVRGRKSVVLLAQLLLKLPHKTCFALTKQVFVIRENPADTRFYCWPPCFPLCGALLRHTFFMRRKFLFPYPVAFATFREKAKSVVFAFSYILLYSRSSQKSCCEPLRVSPPPDQIGKAAKKSPCTARIQGLVRKFKQSDVLPRRAAHAIKSKMPAFCGTMKFSCTLYRLRGNLSTVFRAPREFFTVSRSSL